MRLAKKSLGQNFLIDKNIIKKIIKLVKIQDRDIIEIGPGTGALTDEILKNKPRSLTIIEKDTNLFENLKLKYSNRSQIKYFNKDILDFNFEKVSGKKYIIFGNLPYNISSQILVKLLKFKKLTPCFSDLIFMFQKELGEKIIAKFPSINYGRLTILSNFKLKILNTFLVSSSCFVPKPKVTSIVIHFQPIGKNRYKIKDLNNLEKITNLFFTNKRKMINKTVKKNFKNLDLSKISNLNLNSRPANLSPETYYKITEIFEKNK